VVALGNVDAGGGLYANKAAFTILHSRIYGNSAEAGGGVYLNSEDAYLGSNIIFSNTATASGGGLYIWSRDQDWPILRGNVVSGNQAGEGGGILMLADPAAVAQAHPLGPGPISKHPWENNVLVDNRSNSSGGGIWGNLDNGATPRPVLSHTTLVGNSSSLGDGDGVWFTGWHCQAYMTNTVAVNHDQALAGFTATMTLMAFCGTATLKTSAVRPVSV
jgi:parallel beta-helix repeat protein